MESKITKKEKLYFPEIFQGENLKKNYFEGWYFKHSSKKGVISFIPGISLEENNIHVFIQVISKDFSKYIKYNYSEFSHSNNPFYIKIKDNYFSKDGISLNINEKDIKIFGKVEYSNMININKSKISPNIMGPFAYFNFLECYHGVISLNHAVNGELIVEENKRKIKFSYSDDTGYIEKDWGTTFPKSYIWCQANNFINERNTSLFLSIANVPLRKINIKGLICILLVQGKEYRFATYNCSKIKKMKINNIDNLINIVIKKNNFKLYINIKSKDTNKLVAPNVTGMKDEIRESVSSEVDVKLLKGNKTIFQGFSMNAGLELQNY